MLCAYVQPEYWKQQCACVCMCEHLCLRLFSVFLRERNFFGIERLLGWICITIYTYIYTRVLQWKVHTTGAIKPIMYYRHGHQRPVSNVMFQQS